MIKAIDIAIKDLKRSFRSAFALVFMFGVPLLITVMFAFMFGNMGSGGEFSLPRVSVIVANLDEGGPRFQVNPKNVPGGGRADTLGELIVTILESEDLAELLSVAHAPSAEAARAAVDDQQAQVAIVIPPDFSRQYADVYGQATIEFYQDPTLTIGPGIVRALLDRFMDGMAGVKVAVSMAVEEIPPEQGYLIGPFIQQYLDTSLAQAEDPDALLLAVRSPGADAPIAEEDRNSLASILGPIMGGMLIFYAFFTGTSTAQSILREEEERTLPRLFTTPTPQAVILTGKFLSVFVTVFVQVTVLLLAGRLAFGIDWGAWPQVALLALGTICAAAGFGICLNSFLKDSKQGGVIFGGVLTVTGMLGMIGIFTMNVPTGRQLANTVSLLVPQGWAVRGLLQTMDSAGMAAVLPTVAALLVWSVVFFAVGVVRFNRRYA